MKLTYEGPWCIDVSGDLRPGYYDEEGSSGMARMIEKDPVKALNFAWRQGYARGLRDGELNHIVNGREKK